MTIVVVARCGRRSQKFRQIPISTMDEVRVMFSEMHTPCGDFLMIGVMDLEITPLLG